MDCSLSQFYCYFTAWFVSAAWSVLTWLKFELCEVEHVQSLALAMRKSFALTGSSNTKSSIVIKIHMAEQHRTFYFNLAVKCSPLHPQKIWPCQWLISKKHQMSTQSVQHGNISHCSLFVSFQYHNLTMSISSEVRRTIFWSPYQVGHKFWYQSIPKNNKKYMFTLPCSAIIASRILWFVSLLYGDISYREACTFPHVTELDGSLLELGLHGKPIFFSSAFSLDCVTF